MKDVAAGGEKAVSKPSGPKHYSYELHNIVYTVAEDHDGIFNGSDEFSMKVRVLILRVKYRVSNKIRVRVSVSVRYGVNNKIS
jgi:hypothetical protein